MEINKREFVPGKVVELWRVYYPDAFGSRDYFLITHRGWIACKNHMFRPDFGPQVQANEKRLPRAEEALSLGFDQYSPVFCMVGSKVVRLCTLSEVISWNLKQEGYQLPVPAADTSNVINLFGRKK